MIFFICFFLYVGFTCHYMVFHVPIFLGYNHKFQGAMTTFKSVAELCDVVSHVIYCIDDTTLMLTLENLTNEYWIPSSKIMNNGSWISQSAKDCEEMFGVAIQSRKLLRLYKVWTPLHPTLSHVYHCIYFLAINAEFKKKTKNAGGKYRGKIRWVQEVEIAKMLADDNLRSPEILEFYHLCKGSVHTMLTDGAEIGAPPEMIYTGSLVECNDSMLPNLTNNGMQEQIVESASFTREVQILLLKEFIFLCFPAMYMCQQVFSRLLLDLGWPREDTPHLFRAADISGRCGLSFRDLLYFLAALEPTTSHGGSPAELRCRYMFRFFDRDKDSVLNFNEFKNLISCIRKSKKQTIDAYNVAREAETNFKALNLAPETQSLGLSDFLHAVGDLKLRGTSQIFRSTTSLVQYLHDLQDRELKTAQKNNKSLQKFDSKSGKPATKIETGTQKSQPTGKNVDYELGVHTIRLQKSGTLISIDEIWNVTSAFSHSSTQQQTLSDAFRRHSMDQFNQTSITNEVLKAVRYITQVNKGKPSGGGKGHKNKDTQQFSWGQLDSLGFGRNVITICNQVKEIFKSENRMVEIQSPAYIMGDLHGNINSLFYFEKVLWHLGPGLCPCNLLFLGDYVDRGPYSIEVITYLFCYKLQSPGKMMLLRGNHEIRDIQKMFTFYAECFTKFGDKLGQEVWNSVNQAFDAMPIAANIDGKIFCCHGGIPPPWLCPTVSTINTIPCPLTNPDEQSALAWELMWNDPISKPQQITEDVALELLANDGFAANKRRGTAHIFSTEALERFLKTNGLSFIIRAHEVALAGFNVLQRGKLLTVFSSAKYCGGMNEAACILADQGRLRILRLETS